MTLLLINPAKIHAWIVDLRPNIDVDMYPFLLGLKEFVGIDNVCYGGFIDSKAKSAGQWEIKDGKMLIDGMMQLKTSIKKDIPIIMTSCYTASARGNDCHIFDWKKDYVCLENQPQNTQRLCRIICSIQMPD